MMGDMRHADAATVAAIFVALAIIFAVAWIGYQFAHWLFW